VRCCDNIVPSASQLVTLVCSAITEDCCSGDSSVAVFSEIIQLNTRPLCSHDVKYASLILPPNCVDSAGIVKGKKGGEKR
jgi:hypothetical protein